MARFSKDQVKAFVQDNNLKTMEDVQAALKELFADTLQTMLEAELDHELGYSKHDSKNKKTANSRNGKSKKTIVSEYGESEIQVPRDRNGVSTRDIQDHLSHLYGIDVSPTMISNITSKIYHS